MRERERILWSTLLVGGGRCFDGWRTDGRRWGEEGGKKLGESFGEEIFFFLKMKMFWGKAELRMGK